MARIVLGMGSSHTPMLNATAEDWYLNFAAIDRRRPHRDKDGNPCDFDALLLRADPRARAGLEPETATERHGRSQEALAHLSDTLVAAELDALIVIGDDQGELFGADNQPAIAIYCGDRIPNTPRHKARQAEPWYARALAGYYDEPARDYPVDASLASHLITALTSAEFDVASANAVVGEHGEGHAFGFVHRRLMGTAIVPMVPVFLNTYFPPNQPTPRRCYRLGQALCRAIEDYPRDNRVGILASGGLSHFTVDEELDTAVLQALRDKDVDTLESLPLAKLEAGSSEIRNWICAAGALEGLEVEWTAYVPGYRSEAGTGTGMGFAIWR